MRFVAEWATIARALSDVAHSPHARPGLAARHCSS